MQNNVVRAIGTNQEAMDLVNLAEMHHQELASHLPFDKVYALTNALRLMRSSDRSSENMWVAYRLDKPVGYFIGNISPYYFTKERSANQTLWFVVEGYRHSRIPLLLFDAFQTWAIDQGCLEIYAGSWGKDAEAVEKVNRIYPRMGYELVGSFYVKQVNNEGMN